MAVSIGDPEATVAELEAIPDKASDADQFAKTTDDTSNEAPRAGVVIVTSGGVASRLMVSLLESVRLPMWLYRSRSRLTCRWTGQ